MQVPEGLTEDFVLSEIEEAVAHVSRNFVFGYHELSDVKQIARLYALEALPRYKPGGFNPDGTPKRRLQNFIYTHCKNRLCNFKRDKFRRVDHPCDLCAEGRQSEHKDGLICAKYTAWKIRNDAKSNLMRPLDIESQAERPYRDGSDSEVEDQADEAELIRRLDAAIPAELRADYLRMRASEHVPKARQAKVEAAVRQFLWEENNRDEA